MAQRWTAEDIPNLTGKVAVVTGGNSGVGFEAGKELARQGARVVLACRSMGKAEVALAEIQREVAGARVEAALLDLANLQSVRDFAALFEGGFDRLDILINNAGIMAVPYGTTRDGFESQLGTNHLGHFALTGLLLDLLLSTPAARVVNVSSGAHKMGTMDFDNLMWERRYSPFKGYGRSKLANLLFTYEMRRRLERAGSETIAVAAHPGLANTNLASGLEPSVLTKVMMPAFSWIAQPAAMGALPLLRAAVDPAVRGGEYYGPGGFREMKGTPVRVESSALSHSEEVARELWYRSEQLTGVRYEALETGLSRQTEPGVQVGPAAAVDAVAG